VNKKEAQWDIIGPTKRALKKQPLLAAPIARRAPAIWSEVRDDPQVLQMPNNPNLLKNLHDAQDVLPYFSTGQTILTSKLPRVLARSVLLTRNLHDISVDWRSGEISFSV
jgi:hypothetical protein